MRCCFLYVCAALTLLGSGCELPTFPGLQIRSPVGFKGSFASKSCEVRPGPRFLLRHYTFSRRGRFNLLQFYYDGPDCTSPIYGVQLLGQLTVGHATMHLPGTHVATYALHEIYVIPYRQIMAQRLTELLNRTCPASADRLVLNEPYPVFSKGFSDEKAIRRMQLACVQSLAVSLDELEAVKLLVESAVQGGEVKVRLAKNRYLVLGGLASDASLAQPHSTAMATQPALVDTTGADCDDVCSATSQSNLVHPASLRARQSFSRLFGEWESSSCEARPNGYYLVRQMRFEEGGAAASAPTRWSGLYVFYEDSLCEVESFRLLADGWCAVAGPSAVIAGAVDATFVTERVAVTPRHGRIVSLLNEFQAIGQCGGAPWHAGRPQVLRNASCRALGLRLPHTEAEVARLSADADGRRFQLHFSDREARDHFGADVLVTGFQQPLRLCAAPRPPPSPAALIGPRLTPRVLSLASRLARASSSPNSFRSPLLGCQPLLLFIIARFIYI